MESYLCSFKPANTNIGVLFGSACNERTQSKVIRQIQPRWWSKVPQESSQMGKLLGHSATQSLIILPGRPANRLHAELQRMINLG